jgi:hypothetical protein
MNRISIIKTGCLAGAFAGAVFGATAAKALVLSDELRITDGGGVVRYDLKIFENSTSPETIAPHFVTVKGVTNLFDPTQYGRFIALFDQGPVLRISDVVGIYASRTPTGTVLHFAFASDTEQKSPPLTNWIAPGVPPPPAIPEAGPVNVTRFLNPGLRANHWTAIFTSDLEQGTGGVSSPTALPEPGAWAMLLAGLGGVGLAVRARRRSAT